MIRLQRIPLGEELAAIVAERIARLQTLLAAGEPIPAGLANSYRDPPLKAILFQETCDKCAYCESKITHVYFGDVEHIIPKRNQPGISLTPSNLTVACAQCNNAKSDYHDAAWPLINPFEDNPDDEFLALGYHLTRRPGKHRARITIDVVKLNRMALLERRRERIQALEPLVDQYVAAPDGALKTLLRNELLKQASRDNEYCFVVKAYLHAACDLVP